MRKTEVLAARLVSPASLCVYAGVVPRCGIRTRHGRRPACSCHNRNDAGTKERHRLPDSIIRRDLAADKAQLLPESATGCRARWERRRHRWQSRPRETL